MPLDILCPPPADSLPETHESFAKEHVSKLRSSYDLVRKHLDSSQRCSKVRHDRKSRASPLNVGDRVWLHRHPPPQVSPKFFKYWSGPWEIVKKPPDVTLRMRLNLDLRVLSAIGLAQSIEIAFGNV